MTNLSIIGVNHLDPEGEDKLRDLLQFLSPELVLLEGSESKQNAQTKYIGLLERELISQKVNPEISEILLMEQESKGFETRVSQRYCSQNPPIYFNDSFDIRSEEEISKLARETVRKLKYNYDAQTAKKVFEKDMATIRNFMDLAKSLIGTPEERLLLTALVKNPLGERDSVMGEKLREVHARHPGSKITTITGLKHIINDGEGKSFYSKIIDFNPTRYVL